MNILGYDVASFRVSYSQQENRYAMRFDRVRDSANEKVENLELTTACNTDIKKSLDLALKMRLMLDAYIEAQFNRGIDSSEVLAMNAENSDSIGEINLEENFVSESNSV